MSWGALDVLGARKQPAQAGLLAYTASQICSIWLAVYTSRPASGNVVEHGWPFKKGLLPCNAAASMTRTGWAARAPCSLTHYCCCVCCRQALLNTVQGMQLRLEGLEVWRGRLQGAPLRSPPAEASERVQVGPHVRCRTLA